MHYHESQCCALISGHDMFYSVSASSTSDPVPHLIKLHVTADRRCFLPSWQRSFNLIKLSAASVSFRRVMTVDWNIKMHLLKVPFTNPAFKPSLGQFFHNYSCNRAFAQCSIFLMKRLFWMALLRYGTRLMISLICMKIGWIWILFVSVSMDITDVHRLMPPRGPVPDLPLISIPWRHRCMEANYSKCTLLGGCITLIVLCACMRERDREKEMNARLYRHRRACTMFIKDQVIVHSIYCTI